MKLRTKFAVGFILFSLLLSGATYGGLELYKDRIIDNAQQEVDETASMSVKQLETTIENRKDFVGFVASRPEASEFNHSNRFLGQFVDNSRFFAAQIITRNGTIHDFYGDITQDVRTESIGMNVSGRAYYQRAVAGETYISSVEYTNSTDQYFVIISAPIFEDKEVKGVLAASMYVDRQNFFSMVTPLDTDGRTVRIRSGGRTLYEGSGEFPRNLTSTIPVAGTNWQLTVVRDRSPLDERLRTLALAQSGGLLVIFLFVIGFAVWEYRTTIEQTDELLGAFNALESGDFSYRVDLQAADEWAEISQGFNSLATELDQWKNRLDQHEQRLEVLNRILRHNVRNDATVITGFADIISNRADDTRISEAADKIREAMYDLEGLSNKLREFQDVTDEEYPELQPIDLTPVVESIIDKCHEEYPDATITTSLPDELWAVSHPSIELAIEHLCENACVHNPSSDPHLTIDGRIRDSEVTITIEDDGPGLPAAELSVLERGEESSLEHTSGIGLWISQWVVGYTGGSLRFDADDSGTRATIELEAPSPDVKNESGQNSDAE